jgi:hypothetical protein
MHISELHHKMMVAKGQGKEGDIQLRTKAYTGSIREKRCEKSTEGWLD